MDEKRRRFEALMLPHLDAAYNLARWLTRSDHDADDIVQDALLRAYRSFSGFRGDAAKPWFLAIVRNCHRTALARQRSTVMVPLAEENLEAEGGGTMGMAQLIDGRDDPETAAIRASTSAAVTELLSALPEAFREVLVLRELEDLSYRDIADITGAPIGTVMSRLARARALMRERWLAADPGASDGMR